jgi:Leucine-rich repeat (LRR) protein
LTNMTNLKLDGNQLTGEIPIEIWSLTNLNLLWLGMNQLTGEISPDIGNLTNLTYLRLGDNQFTGEIPENICDLTNLIWVSNQDSWEYSNSTIYMNQLCPPYPSCIEDYVGTQDTTNCD